MTRFMQLHVVLVECSLNLILMGGMAGDVVALADASVEASNGTRNMFSSFFVLGLMKCVSCNHD